jgi:hypothetical protein
MVAWATPSWRGSVALAAFVLVAGLVVSATALKREFPGFVHGL